MVLLVSSNSQKPKVHERFAILNYASFLMCFASVEDMKSRVRSGQTEVLHDMQNHETSDIGNRLTPKQQNACAWKRGKKESAPGRLVMWGRKCTGMCWGGSDTRSWRIIGLAFNGGKNNFYKHSTSTHSPVTRVEPTSNYSNLNIFGSSFFFDSSAINSSNFFRNQDHT